MSPTRYSTAIPCDSMRGLTLLFVNMVHHLDDARAHGPFPLTIFRGRHEIHFGDGLPVLRLCLRPECGVFVAEEKIEYDVSYRLEQDRGYDYITESLQPWVFHCRTCDGQASGPGCQYRTLGNAGA